MLTCDSDKRRTVRWRYLLVASFVFLGFFATTPRPVQAFEMRRAINVAQWFTWPRYEPAPATGILWPPYKKDVPRPPNERELADLKRAGFDTIRLPVDPAPFIVFEGERREEVYRLLFSAISRIRAAGLNVVVDLHPNSRHTTWGQHAVAAGADAPAFVSYLEVVREMARRLHRHSKHAALELINEPRVKCAGAEQQRWQDMAKRLVASARSESKDLTLVLTGACVSSLEGLLALDPAPIGDDNLIYTFHFYDPFSFTHQGASFIPWPDKYLDEVPWPAAKRPIEQSLALIEKRVSAAPNLDIIARDRAADGARANLRKYYRSNASADLIRERFAKVSDWAKTHNISANRIFVGEFGVIRKNAGSAGARCEDRMQWLHDVRSSAEQFGFSWAYFNYDGAFAIVSSDTDRTLDTDVLSSLGLLKKSSLCSAGP
jgi:endoglucanase